MKLLYPHAVVGFVYGLNLPDNRDRSKQVPCCVLFALTAGLLPGSFDVPAHTLGLTVQAGPDPVASSCRHRYHLAPARKSDPGAVIYPGY